MNQEQFAHRLDEAVTDRNYKGELTPYTLQSIEKSRSNYPVSNLLAYCKGYGLRMVMQDMATEDSFFPKTVLEVHEVLGLLMKRYMVDYQMVYRKTGVHYTSPKSDAENKKYGAPLSIKTLLAVCETIHCDILFE